MNQNSRVLPLLVVLAVVAGIATGAWLFARLAAG
jgi:hypothetical protein